MGNLTQFQAEESPTVLAIYDWWKKKGDSEEPRGYLGASIIGHECDRYLWYAFRMAFKAAFDGRLYRLFDRGHREEAVFIAELRGIGCEVVERDADGNQIGISDIGGHFKGHLDGAALGILEAPKTWHVLEFKTANDEQWCKIRAAGVQKAKPMHYAQMQVYMGKTGMTRALYLVTDKDNDRIYGERVRYDAAACRAIMHRAERIIKAAQPPERMASRADDWRCKLCDARDLCWGTGSVAVPLPCKTCRTCCHATPEMDGDARWSCAALKRDLDFIAQQKACPRHLLLPGLISFAAPADAGTDWIEFVNNDAKAAHWRHGDGTAGTWSTEELMRIPGPMVGERVVEQAKTLLGGTVTGLSTEPDVPLVDRYPHEDSRLLWDGPETGLLAVMPKHIPQAALANVTAKEKTATTDAVEYGGNYLVVTYLADGVSAIWQGVE